MKLFIISCVLMFHYHYFMYFFSYNLTSTFLSRIIQYIRVWEGRVCTDIYIY